MDQIVKRIRPKDYELTTVQDNIASALENHIDSVSSALKALAPPASGFKTTISVGSYWNSSYSSGSLKQTNVVVINETGSGLGATPFIMKWTHSGSVVGLTLNQAGSITGINYLYIYKNNNLVYTWTAGAGGNNATFWTTVAKSSVSFTAGDTMTCAVSNSASGNNQVLAHLTLEMGA